MILNNDQIKSVTMKNQKTGGQDEPLHKESKLGHFHPHKKPESKLSHDSFLGHLRKHKWFHGSVHGNSLLSTHHDDPSHVRTPSAQQALQASNKKQNSQSRSHTHAAQIHFCDLEDKKYHLNDAKQLAQNVQGSYNFEEKLKEIAERPQLKQEQLELIDFQDHQKQQPQQQTTTTTPTNTSQSTTTTKNTQRSKRSCMRVFSLENLTFFNGIKKDFLLRKMYYASDFTEGNDL